MEEKIVHGGALLSPEDKRDHKLSLYVDMPAGGNVSATLPRTYECWIPKTLRDQENTASCTAFAMATIFSCIWYKLTGEERDFSTGYLYGNNIEKDYGPFGGAFMRDVVKTAQKHGDILASVEDNNDERPECTAWFEERYPELKEYAKMLVKGYVRISDWEDAIAFMARYGIPLFISVPMKKIAPLGAGDFDYHAMVAYKYSYSLRKLTCDNSWGDYANSPTLRFDDVTEVWGIIPNESIKFPDVSDGMWSYGVIKRCATDGIIQGYTDGKFYPYRKLTREQFCSIWHRIKRYMRENYEEIENKEAINVDITEFFDVPNTRWSYKIIHDTADDGIFEGFEDGTFRPDESVTREQFCAIWKRIKKYMVNHYKDTECDTRDSGQLQFTDVEDTRWSLGDIKSAVDDGLVEGFPDGTFKPAEGLTREQFCAIWARAKTYMDKRLYQIKN